MHAADAWIGLGKTAGRTLTVVGGAFGMRWWAVAVGCLGIVGCGDDTNDASVPDASVLDAGSPNASTSDAEVVEEEACVFVDPGDGSATLRADLDVTGTGFAEFDGRTLRLTAGTWELAPLAVADVRVADGTFALQVPDALVDYTGVGLYIDLDGDERCDTDEPMHQMTTGPASQNTTLALTPSDFAPADCLVNGGVVDLTRPNSCASAQD